MSRAGEKTKPRLNQNPHPAFIRPKAAPPPPSRFFLRRLLPQLPGGGHHAGQRANDFGPLAGF